MTRRILLLGGVTEALRLARTLGPDDIYSLAGLGRVPDDLPCAVRVGGFGGATGLTEFIRAEAIGLLLDVTHPYAAQISRNAADAARQTGVPCWALRRPGWTATPEDDWRPVTDWSELREALKPFRRPFFTLGREPLAHLGNIPPDQFWTVRCLDEYPATARSRVIGDRGPYRLEDERELFRREAFDVLISKNSGSAATEAKLQVARERGLPVLLLSRPALPLVDREYTDPLALGEALRGWGVAEK